MRPKVYPQLSIECEQNILQLRGKKRSYKEIANDVGLNHDHVKAVIKKGSQFVSLDLSAKHKIITDMESGKKISDVAKQYWITERRVKEILKRKDKIVFHQKKCIELGVEPTGKIICNRRNFVLEVTESRILHWIQEQNQEHSRISGDMIKERARTFYKRIATQCGIVSHVFSASDGWLSDTKS